MQIAQVLAGYSLGAADLLRRAMGKKKPEEMAKQRTVFVEGAENNGIETKTAEYIFDMMETFAGYGFNKSHSAAYALLSFQTAWLKAHYPAAYMAATMSADMDHTDKIVGLIADSRSMGLSIQFPDVNRSFYKFEPIDEQTVMYGLGAIKGLGESAIELILMERDEKGAFDDIYDFCTRVASRKVNKRAIEAIIRAGGFDAIEGNRAQLMADLPRAMEIADQNNQNNNAGQSDLFGLSVAKVVPQKREVSEWNELRRLSEEREALGLYLSGHPFDYYRRELETISDMQRCQKVEKQLPNAVIAGMIVDLRVINTRRGDKMAFISLDDGVSRVEVSLFSELYGLCHPLLGKDKILIITGELKRKEGGKEFEIIAQSASDVEALRRDQLQAIRISVKSSTHDKERLAAFKKMLSAYMQGGNVMIEIIYQRENGVQGLIQLGDEWAVKACDELFDEINTLFGPRSIQYVYDAGEIRNGLIYKAPPPKFNYNRRDSNKPRASA